jgi:phospholipase C
MTYRAAGMLLPSLLAALLPLPAAAAPTKAAAKAAATAAATATPIEHLIVVVGENITFDSLFATYTPPPGEAVSNLLSKGIVEEDGTPGPHFDLAAQHIATATKHYSPMPEITGAFKVLPRPGTTYAFGLPQWAVDSRFPGDLPDGPYPITRYALYESHVGDPVHRFFQMWQQVDGGKLDLFPWVATTSGEGSRNRDDPSSGTNQGAVAMGFYNMAKGDAAYFKELAQHYAIADNYHQPIMGGTGANYLSLSTGYAGSYMLNGQPALPPANQIENPEPRPGTDNWYTQSGYKSGSYTKCADPKQPGVGAIRAYLRTLPYKVFMGGDCAPYSYYLVNNYEPGYRPDGTLNPLGPDKFVLPPQPGANIGTALAAKHVSWKWYAAGRSESGIDEQAYCSICDPLTHSTQIMTGDLRQNLQGLTELDHDLADAQSLPAVSFVVPPNVQSGHPAYSSVAAFEDFVKQLVAKVQANPEVWQHTALLITTDEGGGAYDSGSIQILDFFGDGTRIPLFVVSPFAKPGHVEHTYYDHVSILKFIERNWHVPPISARSRDHLPNPVANPADAYVPANRPAIGDLMELFKF